MQQVTTDKLMQDLRTVVSDAEELLRATAGQAGEQIRQARARAEESLRAARERLETIEDEVITHVRDSARAADRYVHDHPWGAVGVAASIGFLVGILVARR
jgi:ElaB/YqjD/DUF883 family membrane-anchored ribosome-binding protein